RLVRRVRGAEHGNRARPEERVQVGCHLGRGRYLTCVSGLMPWRPSQAASSSPSGVDAGPHTNGHNSMAIRRQLRVAYNSPSTAPRPRLMRWRITKLAGTLAARRISPCSPVGSKNRRTLSDDHSGVIVV